MTSWLRWTLAVLLGTLGLGLAAAPTAAAAPSAPALDAGVGHFVADLGAVPNATPPLFSFDGAYLAYLASSGDQCDLHLYDLKAHEPVALTHAHVVCSSSLVRWAKHSHNLQWQVNAADGDITAYVWDGDAGQISVLAPDAHVFATWGLSSDGRYLAFTGRSETHPAPSVDAARYAAYVYDRTTGVSLPLSKPDVHVQFYGWSPRGDNFVAAAGGHSPSDIKSDACFGTGTSCRVVPDLYVEFRALWSRDGTAVIGSPGSTGGTIIYDFASGSLTPVNDRTGFAEFVQFLGAGASRLLVNLSFGQAAVWDRTTDKVTVVYAHNVTYAPPTGTWVLFRGAVPETWRYLNPASPHEAAATFRGQDGYWTQDGSSFLGVGPGGCSSLRQWSPKTNTVSIFAPPGSQTCYAVPYPQKVGPRSSGSGAGRFALIDKVRSDQTRQTYVADLRRHVLLGAVQGDVLGFAPAGAPILAVRQPLGPDAGRLLLVDPTPVPDVDDKPRWSAATPATGSRVEVAVGGQVHVTLGASDLQQTPVNLSFRWRATTGEPIASSPRGWSCDSRRLAAGATVADCTFAPPHDYTAARYLDVSATNDATGAQSDTRSYLVQAKPATTGRTR